MDAPIPKDALNRRHTKRLREVYRSAGWPFQDVMECELLAAGLLERINVSGLDCVRLTDAGIQHLAAAANMNRQALSAHEALVQQVARAMLQDGRLVWTNLELRAWVLPEGEAQGQWKWCRPDVFSIRNTSKQAYLEPIVHEIKVSRADLLGDLKIKAKRTAYQDVGGQCWYVLGLSAKGKPIAEPEEIPEECGVMVATPNRLEVLRMARHRAVTELSFGTWMALAKATPMKPLQLSEELQAPLGGAAWTIACIDGPHVPSSPQNPPRVTIQT